jgi:hypothetical protein
MAVDTNYALAMSNGIASVAPAGTAAPTDLSALSAPWVDLGALSTAGLVETAGETRTQFKRWGSIVPFKSVITDQSKTFDINCLERNPNVLSLFYKVATPSPSGAGTSEVQSVTITGVPTGGTFVLTFGDVATTDLPYNATAAAVQAALQALPGIGAGNVTVTGSAGGPYTVTFAGALAGQNVAQLSATGDFIGGTVPNVTVATTTPGVAGALLTVNDDTTGAIDLRAFVFDVIAGGVHDRFYCGKAEVTARKNPTYTTAALTEYGMTITAYPSDSTGLAVQRIYTAIS